MSNNINTITSHRDDLLKAEIATYFILMDKTNINFWQSKGYLTDLEPVVFKFDDFLNSLFLKNHNIDFFDENNQLKSYNLIDDLLKNWRSAKNPLQKILARGCENVNSGIDKGALPDTQQIQGKLYISNAFGSSIKEMDPDYLDKHRECFLQRFHDKFSQNDYYNNPDWKAIRDFIVTEIKCWYSNLLSDTRFPANDVTLWDQAYMTASMFKATLADCYLEKNTAQKVNKPQSIQWRILGIQYDKLGLAEKASKPAIIATYRSECQKFDEQVKTYLETEIALGNEIYRDETGIYFLVPENLLYKEIEADKELQMDLLDDEKIIEAINQKADKVFHQEIQPVYVLSKASRGTMNLTQLLENAKELRLYAPQFDQREFKDSSRSSQICRVCGIRFADTQKEEEINEIPLCETCRNRKSERLRDWNSKRSNEAIWLDELQDKNSRIALLTIRFELNEWLNGNMLSSCANRKESYSESKNSLKSLLNRISQKHQKNPNVVNVAENFLSFYEDIKNSFILFFDEDSIQKIFKTIVENEKLVDSVLKQPFQNLNNFKKSFKSTFWNTIEHFLHENSVYFDSYQYTKDYNNNDRKKTNPTEEEKKTLCGIFTYQFFMNQLNAILLDRSNGTTWQKLIKDKIGIENSIDWAKLTDKQIDEMASILIQFLLRKNPSTARLRRIWESTQRFTKKIQTEVTTKLSAKRIVWDVETWKDSYQNMEIESNGMLFYFYDKKAFLITSLAKCFNQIYDFKKGKSKNYSEWLRNSKHEISDFKLPAKIKVDKNEIEISNPQFEDFQSCVSLLDPTPVSWQVAVPADKVPDLIEMIQKKYKEHFRYVYGKLPLHIGVVVKNFKHPLYIGMQALRNIRREVSWEEIKAEIDGIHLKAIQKDQVAEAKSEETANSTETYYSLFKRNDQKGEYQFYFPPETQSKHLSLSKESGEAENFFYYPNTIDFEFLDCNTRRNDIFYESGKRKPDYRHQRPFTWEHWYKYQCFKELFTEDSSQLHNLISLFYRLLQDWKNEEQSTKQLAATSIINMLRPQNMSDKNKATLACLFGTEKWEDITKKIQIKHLLEFIDYNDFWHNNLKEV
ncbi:MAG: CRISPR-associated protein Csx11 [Candidatus Cloacimonetes bacterium]|nr:CRISPR-associated protein Csx11 [Candidatus Cloacimonadota bacterium]